MSESVEVLNAAHLLRELARAWVDGKSLACPKVNRAEHIEALYRTAQWLDGVYAATRITK